ncbi:hypothetical protein QBC35DRAFT_451519 [Podospora australis]|uniref:Uncharacterized protein n=1 Tax=Podospora australis TaxID=1536484 RepID=A0AAN7AI88_9PEZI|nr:hypothetical protein QBC35DRAFT_451519 [Podospora australis]
MINSAKHQIGDKRNGTMIGRVAVLLFAVSSSINVNNSMGEFSFYGHGEQFRGLFDFRH